jgi:hypothetical protein
VSGVPEATRTAGPGQAFDAEAFHAVQARLVDLWPDMTFRSTTGIPRTVLVISSFSLELPAHLAPLVGAYEERYLCYVLLLAKSHNTRVVYVTSQPMLPRLVDYYLSLIPGLDPSSLRERLTVVSLGDNSFRPLTEKILERPRVVRRLRELMKGPGRTLMVPFVTSELEARLGVELDVPVYGSDPSLHRLGTKSGSREVFAASGVPGPCGVAGAGSLRDIVAAVLEVQARTRPDAVMLKVDDGVSGLGNAVVRLQGATTASEVEQRVLALETENPNLSTEQYLGEFERSTGVVEELLAGDELTSPSVQLRASPLREVEILSTHDQVLGGRHQQTYLGCKFPADARYAAMLAEPATAIGEELAARGAIGRFAIDFVVSRNGRGPWRAVPVEVNLRNGGTTHPMLTLQALTDASYDAATGELVSRGRAKRYLATDHLEHPAFSSLTPDDLLDVIDENGLGWDEQTQTGVAFHMASAIAIAGHVGVTAIADSDRQAQWMYDAAKHALIGAATSEG